MKFTQTSLLSALLLVVAQGCASPEVVDSQEAVSSEDALTSFQLVGEYSEGEGRFSDLSLRREKLAGRDVQRYTLKQVVQCIAAPCNPVVTNGTWFANGSTLILSQDKGGRAEFGVALESGNSRLVLSDKRTKSVIARLYKPASADSMIGKVLAAKGLSKLRVKFREADAEAQQKAFGGTVNFQRAFGAALDAYLASPNSVRGSVEQQLSDLRSDGDACALSTTLASTKCFLNRPGSTLNLLGAGSEAPQGENTKESWVFELSVPSLSDEGHYAVIGRKGSGKADVYSFN